MKQCHQIDQYLGGLLRGEELAHFEQHLTTCEECTLLVRKDGELAESFRLMWAQNPSPTTSDSQKHTIIARAFGAKKRKTRTLVWATGVAFAAALAFFMLHLNRPASTTTQEKPSFTLPSQILRLNAATAHIPHGEGQGDVVVREGGSLLFELGADRVGVAPTAECHLKVARGTTTLTLKRGTVAVQKKKGGTQHTFLVTSGPYVVKVVGTRFFVDRTGNSVTAGVSRGTVTVQITGGEQYILPKGTQIHLSPSTTAPAVEPLLPTWRHKIDHLLSLPGAADDPARKTQMPKSGTKPITKPVLKTGTEGTPDLSAATMNLTKRPEKSLTHEATPHPVMRSMTTAHPKKRPARLNPTEIKTLILAGSYAMVEQKLKPHLSAGNPMAWWLLGESQRKRGQFSAAIKAYGKCISLGGTGLANRARYRSALLYHDRLGNISRAIALYRSYLSQPAAQAPLRREASWRLARAYQATGQKKAAIVVLKRMVATYTGVYRKRAQKMLLILSGPK